MINQNFSTRLKNAPSRLVATLMLLNGLLNIGILIANYWGWDAHVQNLVAWSSHFSYAMNRANVLVTIIVALILISLALGLYRGQRSSWRWTLVFLTLLLMRNVFPAINWLPTILAAVSLVILWLSRKSFQQHGQVLQTRTFIAWASGLFAVAYGSVGSYLLRDQFNGIHNFIDSIYYTFVTYSTVGYGDIVPKTNDARLFAISMIVIGLGAFATIVSVLIAPMIEKRLKKVLNMVSHFHHLRAHAIICGVNDITLQIAKDLHAKNVAVLFIDDDAEQSARLIQLSCEVLTGDPQNQTTLKAAGLKDASVLICGFQDDARNILLAMTARTVLDAKHSRHQKTKIVVKLDQADRVSYAEQSGADEVIVPSVLSSRQILSFLE